VQNYAPLSREWSTQKHLFSARPHFSSLSLNMSSRCILYWVQNSSLSSFYPFLVRSKPCGHICINLLARTSTVLNVVPRSSYFTSYIRQGKKTDWDATYDRIKKKRDRQEKAKDKAGAKTLEVWQGSQW
jgi:hypothetical protein